MKKILYIYILTICLIACQSNQSDKIKNFESKYTLEQTTNKNFFLDSTVSQQIDYLQIFERDSSLFLSFYNPASHNICIYNYFKPDSVLYTIDLYKDGPNRIFKPTGFYIYAKDSIFLYESFTKRLAIVNSAGTIIGSYDLKEKFLPSKNQNISNPYPLASAPLTVVGNELILQGMSHNPKNADNPPQKQPTTALFNIKTNEMKFANCYPKVYGNNDISESWDVFSYRVVLYTLSPQQEMVLSFPADEHITVYNMKTGEQRRYYAGHSQQEKEIKPMREGASRKEIEEHYLEQLQYSGIYYDKYRHLYYRLAILPNTTYTWNDKDTQTKEIAVIILNEDFQKIGEYNTGKKGLLYTFTFISPDGIHINTLSDDDDYLSFLTFKITKI